MLLIAFVQIKGAVPFLPLLRNRGFLWSSSLSMVIPLTGLSFAYPHLMARWKIERIVSISILIVLLALPSFLRNVL